MRYAPLTCAALLVLAACGDSTGPVENDELCTASDTTGTIAAGVTRTESLTAADCILPHEARGDGWHLEIADSTVVQVDLTSTAFDAVVVITDQEFNIVALDDDNAEGTNTSLITALAPGSYTVWASSFDGALGDYTLSLDLAQAPACIVEAPTGSITVGETIQGVLDTGDCQLANGRVAERWQLTVDPAQSVRVDLRSTPFDTYLYISDAAGRFIAADDDAGDGTNSRLQLTLDTGTYLLWASSFGMDVGTFELSVASTAPVTGPEASSAHYGFESLRVKRTRGPATWKVSPR